MARRPQEAVSYVVPRGALKVHPGDNFMGIVRSSTFRGISYRIWDAGWEESGVSENGLNLG